MIVPKTRNAGRSIVQEISGYEIRFMDAGNRLLFVLPTIGLSREEAHERALELLSLHGGVTFTLKPQQAPGV